MRKIFLLLFLSFYNFVVYPHVEEEGLFRSTFIFKDSGSWDSSLIKKGSILFVHGLGQFSQFVLQNEKPVVVKVCKGKATGGNKALEVMFEEVAGSFQQKVSFVAMDIMHPDNSAVIKQLLGKLGIQAISVPFFLFFNQRTLMLPPLVLPPVFGFIAPEKVNEIKKNFINYIEKQFFLKSNKKQKIAMPYNRYSKNSQDLSTLDKIVLLSDKVNEWLTGLKNVSPREMKAYYLSKK